MTKFGADNFNQGNDWREYCARKLESQDCDVKVKVVNPNDYFNYLEKTYLSQREIMNFDLYKLRSSDLVIVNFNDKYSLGTMGEISIAHERRIPVIGLNTEKQELHPWQYEMCERIFDDIDEMLCYVLDYYIR